MTHVEDQLAEGESNRVLLFARVIVGGLVVEFSRNEANVEKPYLMLRLDRICVDTTLADLTVGVQAQLGSVQLVDKQNLGWLLD